MGIWWVMKVGARETASLRGVIRECGPLTCVGRESAGSLSLCAAYASAHVGRKVLGRHQQENRGQRSQCRVSLTGKKEVYQGKHPVFRQEENVMEKEKQALAMTEDSWKH